MWGNENMKLKLLIILILLNILIPIKSSAQTFNKSKFESISIDEGLSNEHITSIFQDSKGYMWIGTKDGLNRYDGERIKIYNCNSESKNTLSSTYITDIEEDINGNIWIATDYGLDFLVTDTGEIVRMKDLENDRYNLGKLKITSLLKSSYDENVMWVGTENGLMRVDLKNEKIKAFYHDENNLNSLTNSSITSLEESENNILWIGTKQGINVIDTDLKINNNIDKKSFKNEIYISDLSKDNLGNIWISSKEGIILYNKSDYDNGFLWIIEDNGIKKFDVNKKTLEDIYILENNKIKL